jgi:signal peptidase II
MGTHHTLPSAETRWTSALERGCIVAYTALDMVLLISATLSCLFSLLAAFFAGQMTSVMPVAGRFIQLTLSKNPGIAFGIFLPSPWQEIGISAALLIVCLVAIKTKLTRPMQIAFGLIIGGAIANLLDRIITGAVTDYIAVGSFPIFNLADTAITIGACLLLIEGWMKRKDRTTHTRD